MRDEQTEMSTESISTTELSQVGQLRSVVRHWEDSAACRQVLEIIHEGYNLPFKTMPSQVTSRHNISAQILNLSIKKYTICC